MTQGQNFWAKMDPLKTPRSLHFIVLAPVRMYKASFYVNVLELDANVISTNSFFERFHEPKFWHMSWLLMILLTEIFEQISGNHHRFLQFQRRWDTFSAIWFYKVFFIYHVYPLYALGSILCWIFVTSSIFFRLTCFFLCIAFCASLCSTKKPCYCERGRN